MAKRNKNKNKKTDNELAYPTMFVLEGSMRCYQEGSMHALHLQVTTEEWMLIVRETVEYKVFIDCLKTVAIPILKEEWTKGDEWCRAQLERAIIRMRDIDSLAVAQVNVPELTKIYSEKMKTNATELSKTIETLRKTNAEFDKSVNDGILKKVNEINISNL